MKWVNFKNQKYAEQTIKKGDILKFDNEYSYAYFLFLGQGSKDYYFYLKIFLFKTNMENLWQNGISENQFGISNFNAKYYWRLER